MVLWVMRECGARDVPTFKAFRSMQKHVRDLCGVTIRPSVSDLGNLFYTTDIRELIKNVSWMFKSAFCAIDNSAL